MTIETRYTPEGLPVTAELVVQHGSRIIPTRMRRGNPDDGLKEYANVWRGEWEEKDDIGQTIAVYPDLVWRGWFTANAPEQPIIDEGVH